MICADRNWHKILKIARSHQQQYYELLPDWTKYQKHEYKYLWQNIGYAIFGPPTVEEGGVVTVQDKCDVKDVSDATDVIHYNDKSKEVIDIIYKKIYKFGYGDKGFIYYGIIYNIIFRTKNKPVASDKSTNADKNENNDLGAVPIFKVKRQLQDKENDSYEVWYIDTEGRIYKNWTDYKTSNTLPKCTMVLPQDGIYQLDLNYSATEEYSTVWLDIVESPACGIKSVILNGIDKFSNATGIAGLGFCVASFFTPAVPIVLSAAVLSAVNGVWAIGRSTGNLVDRSSHKESINITDKNAFSSWLSISGSTLGLAATGGTAAITKLVRKGSDINNIVRTAYNVVLVGNLGVNGVGIGYQAYSMYARYHREQGLRLMDITTISAHLLFFANAVVNLKYAGELIEGTQGQVLDDYKATLRSRHLRKSFNRARRSAAVNHTDKTFENAEVIRYINRKLSFNNQVIPNNNPMCTSNILQDSRQIIIKGIIMLDPIKFVDILINDDKNSSEEPNSDKNMYIELITLLQSLTKSVVDDNVGTNLPEFYGIFRDMQSLENGLGIFVLLIKIALAVMKYCPSCERKVYNSLHFVWNYIKQSVRSAFQNINFSIAEERIQKMINEITLKLFEEIEMTAISLGPAFKKYILYGQPIFNTSATSKKQTMLS